MATWKKIIVSGSNAELNQVQAVGFSGSFTGSFTGSLFGTASYAATASFVESSSYAQTASYVNRLEQPTVSIANSLQVGTHATASGDGAIAVGTGSQAFGPSAFAAGLYNYAISPGATALGFNNLVQEGTGSVVVGRGNVVTGDYNFVAGTSNIAGGTDTVVVGQWNSEASASMPTASFVIGNGTGNSERSNLLVAGGDQIQISGSILATGSVVDFTQVTAISGSVFSGSFVGDGSGLTGVAGRLDFRSTSGSTITGSVELKTQVLNITGSANQVITSASGQDLFVTLADHVIVPTASISQNLTVGNLATIGSGSVDTTLVVGTLLTAATASITSDLTVGGNLYVQGTASYVNTQDLYVEDQFILLASGSVSGTDGGIIIDRGNDAAKNIAFGYDNGTRRFGYQNGIVDTDNAVDFANNPASSSYAGIVLTETNHGAVTGSGFASEFVQKGAIFTADNGDIFIFS